MNNTVSLKVINSLSSFPVAYSVLGRTLGAHLQSKKCSSPNECIDVCFNSYKYFRRFGWSIKPSQIETEIYTLLSILRKRNARVILEIGTFNGGTLFLFSKMISPDAKIISIDLPTEETRDGGYEKFKISLFEIFAQKKQKITLLRVDSHSILTLSKLQAILKKDKIDFLFIDGDHSFEGVKKDFEMYSPLVKEGGLIAFHDVCVGNARSGVDKFWIEIKDNYTHQEIIENPKQGCAGIGLLYV